jgi:glutamine amidotransferase
MEGLLGVGGDVIIRERVAADRPVLGICVGHQILFGRGDEHGSVVDGVGIYPGLVTQLPAVRLPHMGWNEVTPDPGTAMFAGVSDQRFYFVHSYAALTRDDLPEGATISWAQHETYDFVAGVEWGRVWSTQFHPEKSGPAGARLLRNWLSTL